MLFLGSDADGTSSSTNDTEQQEAWEDLVAIFGLPSKEFQRSSRQVRLEDLNAKQLAVCFSNVMGSLGASDIMQIGGEVAASWHVGKSCCKHCRAYSMLV